MIFKLVIRKSRERKLEEEGMLHTPVTVLALKAQKGEGKGKRTVPLQNRQNQSPGVRVTESWDLNILERGDSAKRVDEGRARCIVAIEGI